LQIALLSYWLPPLARRRGSTKNGNDRLQSNLEVEADRRITIALA